MICVSLKQNKQGDIFWFEVKGHSGQAPAGNDIVCAGVSAIVQTALIGLEEVAEVKNAYTLADGFVECQLPLENISSEKKHCAAVILKTMRLGIESIAEQYPEFVRILVEL